MRTAPPCPTTFPCRCRPSPIHFLAPPALPSPNPPSSLAGAALPRPIFFPFPRHRRTSPRLNLQRHRQSVVQRAALPLPSIFWGADDPAQYRRHGGIAPIYRRRPVPRAPPASL
ncbi:hypothetical protein VPH35_051714 [Triticum aestivum]